jgi:hypothetical protein
VCGKRQFFLRVSSAFRAPRLVASFQGIAARSARLHDLHDAFSISALRSHDKGTHLLLSMMRTTAKSSTTARSSFVRIAVDALATILNTFLH